jgi:ArsR family transcriptional regulator
MNSKKDKHDNFHFILRSCLEREAEIVKAIGHSVRLKLLIAIYENKGIVKSLVNCVEQPQPIVSQQLAVLRKHSIIEGIKDGNKINYKIIEPITNNIIRMFVER